MIVAELIEKLKEMPQDFEIFVRPPVTKYALRVPLHKDYVVMKSRGKKVCVG